MKIRFGDAIKDIFKTPKAWTTILLLALCTIIPLVGPVVMIGYLLQRFARCRKGMEEQDFSFDQFSEYLTIGLWPMLTALVLSVIAMPLIMICYVPFVASIAFIEETPVVSILLVLLGCLLFIACAGFMIIFSWPIMLRSGLMMEFGAGFSWKFIKSFIRKVGLSVFGWYMLLMLISIPASLIGMLALYVGAFFVSVITFFATYHILFQHYDLFIERGGEEIPINPRILTGPAPPAQLPPSINRG